MSISSPGGGASRPPIWVVVLGLLVLMARLTEAAQNLRHVLADSDSDSITKTIDKIKPTTTTAADLVDADAATSKVVQDNAVEDTSKPISTPIAKNDAAKDTTEKNLRRLAGGEESTSNDKFADDEVEPDFMYWVTPIESLGLTCGGSSIKSRDGEYTCIKAGEALCQDNDGGPFGRWTFGITEDNQVNLWTPKNEIAWTFCTEVSHVCIGEERDPRPDKYSNQRPYLYFYDEKTQRTVGNLTCDGTDGFNGENLDKPTILKMVDNSDVGMYANYNITILKFKKGQTPDPGDSNELFNIAVAKFGEDMVGAWSFNKDKCIWTDTCVPPNIVSQIPSNLDESTVITFTTRNGNIFKINRIVERIPFGGQWYGEDDQGNFLHVHRESDGTTVGSLYDLLSNEITYFYDDADEISDESVVTGNDFTDLQIDVSGGDVDPSGQVNRRRNLALSQDEGIKYIDILVGWTAEAECMNFCKARTNEKLKLLCEENCVGCKGRGDSHKKMILDMEEMFLRGNTGAKQSGLKIRFNLAHSFCHQSYSEYGNNAPGATWGFNTNAKRDIANRSYQLRSIGLNRCVGVPVAEVGSSLALYDCDKPPNDNPSLLRWQRAEISTQDRPEQQPRERLLFRLEDSRFCATRQRSGKIGTSIVLGECFIRPIEYKFEFDSKGLLEIEGMFPPREGGGSFCWDARDTSTGDAGDSSAIVVQECENSKPSQMFDHGEYNHINPYQNMNRWLCLSSSGDSILLDKCSEENRMLWRHTSTGLYRWKKNPTMCLARGSDLLLSDCDPASEFQQWVMKDAEAVEDHEAIIISQGSVCMEIDSNNSIYPEFSPVTFATCSATSPSQYWRMTRVVGDGEGLADVVARKKVDHRADVVHFMIANTQKPLSCGEAFLPSDYDFVPQKNQMIAVSQPNLYCSQSLVPIHEIGHTFGCQHDRGTASKCDDPKSNFGYRAWSDSTEIGGACDFRTLMAYPCELSQRRPDCQYVAGSPSKVAELPIPRFSTPNYSLNGKPTGDDGHNNVEQINFHRTTVSDFTCRVGSGGKITISMVILAETLEEIPSRFTVFNSKGSEEHTVELRLTPAEMMQFELILPDGFGCVEPRVRTTAASSKWFVFKSLQLDSTEIILELPGKPGPFYFFVVGEPFEVPAQDLEFHDGWDLFSAYSGIEISGVLIATPRKYYSDGCASDNDCPESFTCSSGVCIAPEQKCPGQQPLHTQVDLTVGERFGSKSAIDGNTIVVGATDYPHLGTKDGAVFIYNLVDGLWNLQQEIPGIDLGPVPADLEVDISGDTIIISKNSRTVDSMTSIRDPICMVYGRGSTGVWSLEQEISAAGNRSIHYARLYKNNIVLLESDNAQNGQGFFESIVRVFTRDDRHQPFSEEQVFTILTTNTVHRQLVFSGDTIVISFNSFSFFEGTPQIFFYSRDDLGIWQLQQELLITDINPAALRFGELAINEEAAEIVAVTYTELDTALYLLSHDGEFWSSKQNVDSYQKAIDGGVAIDGDTILWGDRSSSSSGGRGGGVVRRYSRIDEIWSFEGLIIDEEGSSIGDFFGFNVDISGKYAVISSPQGSIFNPPVSSSGRAIAYCLDEQDISLCDDFCDCFRTSVNEPFCSVIDGECKACFLRSRPDFRCSEILTFCSTEPAAGVPKCDRVTGACIYS